MGARRHFLATFINVSARFIVGRMFIAWMTVTMIGSFSVLATSVQANIAVLRALINIDTCCAVVRRQLETIVTLELFLANKAGFIKNVARWAEAHGIQRWIAIMRAPAVRNDVTWVSVSAGLHIVVKIHVIGTFAYYFFIVWSAWAVK